MATRFTQRHRARTAATGHRSRSATLVQRGFTLVELMIAMTLGLLLLGVLLLVFLSVSRTNTEMTKTNGLIENGRFAINLLQEDIAHGGYWGGYVPNFDNLISSAVPADAPSATAPDPCLAFSTANWTTAYKTSLLGIPAQSYDVVPAGCTTLITDKAANTDVLVIRHANLCAVGATSCEVLNNGKVYFQASFCEAETTATIPVRYELGNTAANFTLKKRGCTGTPPGTVGTLTDKYKFVSNIYYIRTYAVSSGDGIPTLVRSTFDLTGTTPAFGTPVALIEGIEGFKVEMGLDNKGRCNTTNNYTTAVAFVRPSTCAVDSVVTANNTLPSNRGDGVPEFPFVRCTTSAGCTGTQLTDLVAVKIYVLTRSKETAPGYVDSKSYALGSTTLGPFTDGYKRHVFTNTVRLNNISGRRETP